MAKHVLDATSEERKQMCQDALMYILDIARRDGISAEQRYKIIEKVISIESASFWSGWHEGYEVAKESYRK